MFMDLDLVNRFRIDQRTLCRWLLTVKKNYRSEVKYHNWRHAFSVAQVTTGHCQLLAIVLSTCFLCR